MIPIFVFWYKKWLWFTIKILKYYIRVVSQRWNHRITKNLGISIYPNTNTMDELYKHADRNLYMSKDVGGDTYTK